MGQIDSYIVRPENESTRSLDVILKQRIPLVQGNIPPKQVCYRFEAFLPRDLPPTTAYNETLHSAGVSYSVNAVLTLSDGRMKVKSLPFQVTPSPFLPSPPPPVNLDTIRLGRFSMYQKVPVNIKTRLNKPFVCPGQTITLDFQAQNFSSYKHFNTIRVALKRRVTLRTQGDEAEEKVLYAIKKYPGFDAKTEREFRIAVPQDLSLYSMKTGSFDCEYFVHVQMIAGFFKHAAFDVPVYITGHSSGVGKKQN